jgi:hypothetical protein
MKALVQDIQKQLTPPRWDAWQTMLLLAVFSAIMAAIAEPPVENFIASCGWIWLILSVWWFVYENKKALTFGEWFIGPWVVGALIGGFFASNFPIPIAIVLILWAPLSAGIAILPTFIKSNGTTKEPEWSLPAMGKRQGALILVLTHLLIACWVQFYFLLQNWLTAYPSLQVENLDNSAFVKNFWPDKAQSRGQTVLQVTEAALKDKLAPMDWPQVERWLLEFNKSLPELETDVKRRMSNRPFRFAEDQWWGLAGRVIGGEYDLELRAEWEGPTGDTRGHTVSKVCQINPKTVPVAPKAITVKPNNLKAKDVISSLPRFRTIAKIQCSAPSEPTAADQVDDGMGL